MSSYTHLPSSLCLSLYAKCCLVVFIQPKGKSSLFISLHARSVLFIRNTRLLYLECTYTPDAIHALKLIQTQLEKQYTQTQQDLQRTNTLIQQYRSLGTLFPDLIKEHTRLITRLQQNEHYLVRLQKERSTAPTSPSPQLHPTTDPETTIDMDIE